MATHLGRTQLPCDDYLYRRLRPGQFNIEQMSVDRTGFIDANWESMKGLSVFWSAIATPRTVLDLFADLRGVQRDLGNPTAEELVDRHGFGIGILSVNDIYELGLDFFKKGNGDIQIKPTGHVDVVRGHQFAIELAKRTTPLLRSQIF
jgi:hypothetical protein